MVGCNCGGVIPHSGDVEGTVLKDQSPTSSSGGPRRNSTYIKDTCYKKCKFSRGCDKHAAKGGYCIAHGGSHGERRCKWGGQSAGAICDKIAQRCGLCKRHFRMACGKGIYDPEAPTEIIVPPGGFGNDATVEPSGSQPRVGVTFIGTTKLSPRAWKEKGQARTAGYNQVQLTDEEKYNSTATVAPKVATARSDAPIKQRPQVYRPPPPPSQPQYIQPKHLPVHRYHYQYIVGAAAPVRRGEDTDEDADFCVCCGNIGKCKDGVCSSGHDRAQPPTQLEVLFGLIKSPYSGILHLGGSGLGKRMKPGLKKQDMCNWHMCKKRSIEGGYCLTHANSGLVDKELGSHQLSASKIAELREARAAKRACIRDETQASAGGEFDVKGGGGGKRAGLRRG